MEEHVVLRRTKNKNKRHRKAITTVNIVSLLLHVLLELRNTFRQT